MAKNPKSKKSSKAAPAKSATTAAVEAPAVGDTPFDNTRIDVPVGYRTAQAVLSLAGQAGYNSVKDEGSIALNARNSGVPSTEEEARDWATKPPFDRVEPVEPVDFEQDDEGGDSGFTLQRCTAFVASHPGTSLETTNFNLESRVVLLIENASSSAPRSVVFACDDFLNGAGVPVSAANVKTILDARFDPRNPLNS